MSDFGLETQHPLYEHNESYNSSSPLLRIDEENRTMPSTRKIVISESSEQTSGDLSALMALDIEKKLKYLKVDQYENESFQSHNSSEYEKGKNPFLKASF
ncbi:hypothetical protein AYI68_g6081 [Smittium mucronatum]|uniref:Uncharacterized protein n=1 Tax=Smittium mucronatum TaxID=133383 RepID=A0A1R0GSI7_9FUNG|nr:hypothetical protein AYI68_g6081 [Smittium mucronatum]